MGAEVGMGGGGSVLGSGECAPRAYKPVTINDLKLNELIVTLHRNSSLLDYFSREGKESSLFMALSDIEKAAHEAQIRLNEIRFRKS